MILNSPAGRCSDKTQLMLGDSWARLSVFGGAAGGRWTTAISYDPVTALALAPPRLPPWTDPVRESPIAEEGSTVVVRLGRWPGHY